MIPRAWLGRKIGLLFPQLCSDSLGLTFHLTQARTQREPESSPHLPLTLCILHFSIPGPLPGLGRFWGFRKPSRACQPFPSLPSERPVPRELYSSLPPAHATLPGSDTSA